MSEWNQRESLMILNTIKRWMGFGSNGSSGDDPGRSAGGDEMISCEDALSRVYEYLDGELEGFTHAQVKAHFDVCRRCYPHLASEQSFKAALSRAVRGQRAPDELKDRVLQLLSRESSSN